MSIVQPLSDYFMVSRPNKHPRNSDWKTVISIPKKTTGQKFKAVDLNTYDGPAQKRTKSKATPRIPTLRIFKYQYYDPRPAGGLAPSAPTTNQPAPEFPTTPRPRMIPLPGMLPTPPREPPQAPQQAPQQRQRPAPPTRPAPPPPAPPQPQQPGMGIQRPSFAVNLQERLQGLQPTAPVPPPLPVTAAANINLRTRNAFEPLRSVSKEINLPALEKNYRDLLENYNAEVYSSANTAQERNTLRNEMNTIQKNYRDLLEKYNAAVNSGANTAKERNDLEMNYRDLQEKYNAAVNSGANTAKERNDLEMNYRDLLEKYQQAVVSTAQMHRSNADMNERYNASAADRDTYRDILDKQQGQLDGIERRENEITERVRAEEARLAQIENELRQRQATIDEQAALVEQRFAAIEQQQNQRQAAINEQQENVKNQKEQTRLDNEQLKLDQERKNAELENEKALLKLEQYRSAVNTLRNGLKSKGKGKGPYERRYQQSKAPVEQAAQQSSFIIPEGSSFDFRTNQENVPSSSGVVRERKKATKPKPAKPAKSAPKLPPADVITTDIDIDEDEPVRKRPLKRTFSDEDFNPKKPNRPSNRAAKNKKKK